MLAASCSLGILDAVKRLAEIKKHMRKTVELAEGASGKADRPGLLGYSPGCSAPRGDET
jgi:hypothetical protein